jgi:hypothetical protein
MKLIAAVIIAITTLAAGPAQAHDEHNQPVMGEYNILTTAPVDITGRAVFSGVERHPEMATNCTWTIRSSRTSAVGICYNWSQSGNYKFQLAALITNCNQSMWWYGNVGWPYIRGKTSTAKWSYVYTPPGGWKIAYAKVLVWKP